VHRTQVFAEQRALKALLRAVTTPQPRFLVNMLYVIGLFLPNSAVG
jgi:hypothetical protein